MERLNNCRNNQPFEVACLTSNHNKFTWTINFAVLKKQSNKIFISLLHFTYNYHKIICFISMFI